MSVTFTIIVLNGPVKAGEYGSALAVNEKQRPHASPAPSPGAEPNASWLMAAVYPDAALPQADLSWTRRDAQVRYSVYRKKKKMGVPGEPHPE